MSLSSKHVSKINALKLSIFFQNLYLKITDVSSQEFMPSTSKYVYNLCLHDRPLNHYCVSKINALQLPIYLQNLRLQLFHTSKKYLPYNCEHVSRINALTHQYVSLLP